MIRGIIELINKRASKHAEVTRKEKQINYYENIVEEILRSLEKEESLEELPRAIYLLLSDNEELKLRTSKVIYRIIRNLSTEQLLKLDLLFRERTSLDWNFDWVNENPNNMLHLAMSDEEKIAILGLCTFHPNGYFREKSIKLLSEFQNSSIIPYIIIRLNDWVSPLRTLAKEVLKNKLLIENAKEIINNLPLLLRLKNCSRGVHEEIINMVTEFLISDKCRDELLCGLKSKNQKVRYYCYNTLMSFGVFHNATLIKYITKEKIPYIRLNVIRYVINNSSVDELKSFYRILLKDKNPKVRSEVLLAVSKYESIPIGKELEVSLLDRSFAMRETARFLLGKREFGNFAEFYRDTINKGESLVGAIYGLGETGTAQDCKHIECYINTENIRLLRAVMVALCRLNYDGYREFFIDKLNDERVGISKQAKKVLWERFDSSDGELVYKINKEAGQKHVLINTAVLLFSLSKWNNIRYILEFCSSDDEELRSLAKYNLMKWRATFNRSFNKPTERQKELIEEAIKKYVEFVDIKDIKFIEHCM